MFGIGNSELFFIALLALLLFGNKLPSVMRNLGQTFSGFKRNMEQMRNDVRKSIEESEKK